MQHTTPQRKRVSPGWMPRQHGAWAMLTVPLIIGALWGSTIFPEKGQHTPLTLIPLTLLWLIGYFAFQAAALWLRSRFKPRYRAPVLVYSGACVPLAAAIVMLMPELVVAAIPFVPLIVISALCSWYRKDRSVLNNAVTVLASTFMTPVAAYTIAGAPHLNGLDHLQMGVLAWLTAVQFGYFFGTVLYVKTMLRQRGNRTYLIASIAWHGSWMLVAAAGAVHNCPGTWWLVGLFTLFAARAAVFGARAGSGHLLRPAVIGIGEIAASIALTLVLLP